MRERDRAAVSADDKGTAAQHAGTIEHLPTDPVDVVRQSKNREEKDEAAN
jgi:hypothetical protein